MHIITQFTSIPFSCREMRSDYGESRKTACDTYTIGFYFNWKGGKKRIATSPIENLRNRINTVSMSTLYPDPFLKLAPLTFSTGFRRLRVHVSAGGAQSMQMRSRPPHFQMMQPLGSSFFSPVPFFPPKAIP